MYLCLLNFLISVWRWFVQTETCSAVLYDTRVLCWTANFCCLCPWYVSTDFIPCVRSTWPTKFFILTARHERCNLWISSLGLFEYVAKRAYYLCHVCPSVRPSVCPHLSTRLPLDGFPRNLILTTSMKLCRESPNLVKTRPKYRTLYLNNQVRFTKK